MIELGFIKNEERKSVERGERLLKRVMKKAKFDWNQSRVQRMLNQFGIKMSINEVLGIKLADGMYDDGNIQYLKSYAPEKKLKSNMPLIIHQADIEFKIVK